MKLRKLAAMTICSSLCAFSVSAGALGDTSDSDPQADIQRLEKMALAQAEHSYKIPVLRAASRSPEIFSKIYAYGDSNASNLLEFILSSTEDQTNWAEASLVARLSKLGFSVPEVQELIDSRFGVPQPSGSNYARYLQSVRAYSPNENHLLTLNRTYKKRMEVDAKASPKSKILILTTNSTKLDSYTHDLTQRILKNWRPDVHDHTVNISFSLHQNGTVSEMPPYPASVNGPPHESALDALYQSMPFPNLPSDVHGDTLMSAQFIICRPTLYGGRAQVSTGNNALAVSVNEDLPNAGYVRNIVEQELVTQWLPPPLPAGSRSASVEILFSISPAAEMQHTKLIKSSGINAVDMAAIDAARAGTSVKKLKVPPGKEVTVRAIFDELSTAI